MKMEKKKKIAVWSLRIVLLVWILAICAGLFQMELEGSRPMGSLTGFPDLGDSTELDTYVMLLIGSSIGMLCLVKLDQWENMNNEAEGEK